MARTPGQRRSRLQERRTAEDLGGRVTPASGATAHRKGDVDAPDLKVECKTTSGDSYALKRADLEKVKLATIQEGGLDWAMQVEFRRGPGWNERFAVIDWQTYLDLRADSATLKDIQAQAAKRDE